MKDTIFYLTYVILDRHIQVQSESNLHPMNITYLVSSKLFLTPSINNNKSKVDIDLDLVFLPHSQSGLAVCDNVCERVQK